MSAILRLYPRAWRQRYGDEVAALLEERPPSVFDHIDLIRGALDAHLHPQVPGTDVAPEQEIPMTQKLLALVAAIGGVAWIVAAVSLFVAPIAQDGSWDAPLAIIAVATGIALTGIALGELGTRPGSPASSATGHVIAGLSVASGVMIALPWPFILFGMLGFLVLGVGAALRASQNDALPSWLALVIIVGTLATTAGTMGQGPRNSDVGPLLIGSAGIAALALALVALNRQTDVRETSPT